MKRYILMLSLAGIALGVAGCQKKAEPAPVASTTAAPPTPPPAVAAAATPPVAAPAPTPAAADLPTSVDFEQKAQDEINPQNMEQELDKLELQIGK